MHAKHARLPRAVRSQSQHRPELIGNRLVVEIANGAAAEEIGSGHDCIPAQGPIGIHRARCRGTACDDNRGWHPGSLAAGKRFRVRIFSVTNITFAHLTVANGVLSGRTRKRKQLRLDSFEHALDEKTSVRNRLAFLFKIQYDSDLTVAGTMCMPACRPRNRACRNAQCSGWTIYAVFGFP